MMDLHRSQDEEQAALEASAPVSAENWLVRELAERNAIPFSLMQPHLREARHVLELKEVRRIRRPIPSSDRRSSTRWPQGHRAGAHPQHQPI